MPEVGSNAEASITFYPTSVCEIRIPGTSDVQATYEGHEAYTGAILSSLELTFEPGPIQKRHPKVSMSPQVNHVPS